MNYEATTRVYMTKDLTNKKTLPKQYEFDFSDKPKSIYEKATYMNSTTIMKGSYLITASQIKDMNIWCV